MVFAERVHRHEKNNKLGIILENNEVIHLKEKDPRHVRKNKSKVIW